MRSRRLSRTLLADWTVSPRSRARPPRMYRGECAGGIISPEPAPVLRRTGSRRGGLVTTYPQSLQRHASTGWLGKPKRGRKCSAQSAANLVSPLVLQIGHHGVIRLTYCEFNLIVYAGSLEGTHRSRANVAGRLGNAKARPLEIAHERNCSWCAPPPGLISGRDRNLPSFEPVPEVRTARGRRGGFRGYPRPRLPDGL